MTRLEAQVQQPDESNVPPWKQDVLQCLQSWIAMNPLPRSSRQAAEQVPQQSTGHFRVGAAPTEDHRSENIQAMLLTNVNDTYHNESIFASTKVCTDGFDDLVDVLTSLMSKHDISEHTCCFPGGSGNLPYNVVWYGTAQNPMLFMLIAGPHQSENSIQFIAFYSDGVARLMHAIIENAAKNPDKFSWPHIWTDQFLRLVKIHDKKDRITVDICSGPVNFRFWASIVHGFYPNVFKQPTVRATLQTAIQTQWKTTETTSPWGDWNYDTASLIGVWRVDKQYLYIAKHNQCDKYAFAYVRDIEGELQDQQLALSMGNHPRLGKDSPFADLDSGIIETIGRQLTPHPLQRAKTFTASSSSK
jgi:hypothetical protein